jgi:7-cyano-7-deazaguanine synthase
MVFPIYVRNGFIWEKEELKALQVFLGALNDKNVQPITTLSLPVHSLYGNHWSLSGDGIPSQDDDDNKTYLPGRNVLLLSVGAVWCSMHAIPRIGIGTLNGNPFPDATLAFFSQFGKTVSGGLGFQITVHAPFCERVKKQDLIRQYQKLPLELSLTCMSPQGGKHCGQCNKCRERQNGFKAAGVEDKTNYVKRSLWN